MEKPFNTVLTDSFKKGRIPKALSLNRSTLDHSIIEEIENLSGQAISSILENSVPHMLSGIDVFLAMLSLNTMQAISLTSVESFMAGLAYANGEPLDAEIEPFKDRRIKEGHEDSEKIARFISNLAYDSFVKELGKIEDAFRKSAVKHITQILSSQGANADGKGYNGGLNEYNLVRGAVLSATGMFATQQFVSCIAQVDDIASVMEDPKLAMSEFDFKKVKDQMDDLFGDVFKKEKEGEDTLSDDDRIDAYESIRDFINNIDGVDPNGDDT